MKSTRGVSRNFKLRIFCVTNSLILRLMIDDFSFILLVFTHQHSTKHLPELIVRNVGLNFQLQSSQTQG